MKELSKANQAIIEAYNRGYRIDKNGVVRNPKNKILKGNLNNKGYLTFTYKPKSIQVYYHRFQGYIKYSKDIFNKDLVLRHLDSKKLNNSWDNIVIGTHQDNMLDVPKEIRLKKSLIASSKIKIHDHKAILKDRANGMTYSQLMKKYNISSKGTISFIINKSYDKE